MKSERLQLIWLAGILMLTALIFAPAVSFNFVNWDDFYYVTDNVLIRDLSWPNIVKIFSTDVMGNYQPLVVLSLAFDFKYYGFNPAGYHLMNILFHSVNVVLVFGFLRLIRQSLRMCLWVSFLFALHPLRVESVVWITERKDVLFLCVYLSSLNFYLLSKRFAGQWNPYFIGALFFFVLSLISKPSAVSLPFILLLLDWKTEKKISWKDIVDKSAFFILSIGLALMTLRGYYTPFEYDYLKSYVFPAVDYFFMGFASILLYLGKLLWPTQLVCYYPYPQKVNGMLPNFYYAAPLIFIGLIGVMYRLIQNKKLFVFGSLFFGISIFTNLSFFNFGNVIMADRYSYLPSIGFFLVVVQFLEEIYLKVKIKIIQLELIGVVLTAMLLMCLKTFTQVFVWQNSETLWTQVLRYYPRETMALYNRGNHFASVHEYEKAIKDYSAVISVDPKDDSAFNNRGNMYLILGQNERAFNDYNQSIDIDPRSPKAYLNRVEYFRVTGDIQSALNDIDAVLKLKPNNASALQMKNKLVEKLNSSP